MPSTFWNGRRVLVTGHTGFKGSWLALWLLRLGARVSGFALPPPTTPSLYALAGLAGEVAGHEGDLRDLDAVRAAVAAERPEVVLHLGAQPLVRASYRSPVETYAVNVLGTAHVLEALRGGDALAAVVVTSDKCYQNREWVWSYREPEPLGGHDPYSSSKACAELVTAAYRASFLADGPAVATARAGNVIGGGDWAEDRLIPDAVGAFLEGRALAVRHPGAIRPWQHVLEPLRGYLVLAERLAGQGQAYAEAWNFGPAERDARPVGWLLDRLAAAWGEGARWEAVPAEGPHEAGYLKLDRSKAAARLGWEPRLALEQTVELTARWYRAHAAGEPVRALAEAEIAGYEALAA